MTRWIWRSLLASLLAAALLAPPQAGAIPPYSRKYATSCTTCHTIVPKLTHFGEAFRRNGYRFPNVIDSDYVKSEIVPMGQEAGKKDFPNGMWPSYMTAVPMFGFGLRGSITTHPDQTSYAAIADNKTQVSLDRLATAGSLYAVGNIDDAISVLAMVAFSDTSASLDEALVVWSDVVGPRHLANLTVGYAVPTLSAYSRSSAYAVNGALTSIAMNTLYKNGTAFRVTSKYNLAEVNGTLGGRLEYGVGVGAGLHVDSPRPAENYYGHLAWKLGGQRLDGEGGAIASDTTKPWTENSLTLNAFVMRATTIYTSPVAAAAQNPVSDRSMSYGGLLRGQLGSLELNVTGLLEDHSHVTAVKDGAGLPSPAKQEAWSAELSYMFYQWLVAAVRGERITVKPRDLGAATDTRIISAVGMQIRPNLKIGLTATTEKADGQATAGGDWSRLSGSGIYAYSKAPAGTTGPTSWQLSNVVASFSLGF